VRLGQKEDYRAQLADHPWARELLGIRAVP
jgi:hypothetical protein